MDSLCEQLDQLTLEYLEEFGQLLTCKQLIDDTIKLGYFNLSRSRIIMGVNHLSRLQYSERQPMTASTTISIDSSPEFHIEKHVDKQHVNDALKWFGLLSPNVFKQCQKSFQTAIDLVIETCQRENNILRLKTRIDQLMNEKQILLTKENLLDNKSND
jgi:hypothetical protein